MTEPRRRRILLRRSTIPFLLLSGLAAFVVVSLWVGARLAAPSPSEPGSPPAHPGATDVQFRNTFGERLSGWWVPAESACGAVILTHGIRQDRRAMAGRAPFLVDAGYSVLLFDLRAHGTSEGERITFGHRESADAQAAVAFAAERLPGKPIAVIGFSLGAAAALLARPPLDIDALVVEAAYPTLAESVTNKIRIRLGLLADLLAPALLLQLQPRLGVDPDDLRPIDRIGALTVPLLMIAGTEDAHAPLDQSRKLFEAAAEPKRFWAVKGAGHVDFHRIAPADYEQHVLSLFREHLGPCPRAAGNG